MPHSLDDSSIDLVDLAIHVLVEQQTLGLFFYITIVEDPMLNDCVSPFHAIPRMH